MVGKRERDSNNPMRRTTSMTEFAPPDALAAVMEDEEEFQLPDNSNSSRRGAAGGQQDWLSAFAGGGGVPRSRGAGARGAPPQLGRLLRRRDRRVPPRLRALPAPPRARPRHLHVQGRGGVLQPGVQGAAHHTGGVEGQVRRDVDQGRCRGRGQSQRPPRRLRQEGRGHGGRGMTTRRARTYVRAHAGYTCT